MIPTRLIATLTKHTLWLPTIEAQDNPQIETLLVTKAQILKLSMHNNFIL